ncbi:ABC-F family ATP-binding cassette domain-containing protein [Halobacillus karajensis]|uniref:ABC transporter ATP-binding protein YheS n=1 Tax=Halobacillus karajensis TaxID=195088 RepID=A0A059NXT2_9BACI|nr:ABC-F family ATP-binding cassette domain-containing protein [Halobacillus karajensis]CDQ20354.1 putative ABC transporter ATP-binding protein YheS [Halobacillus karajensis]CDQ23578.1 putative ABC transporter ATP-binding protein YheS [Halobacillus karajensis]CDQ27060.1 putative ABC transporter ATP-binding protein YheS [Halobacillus karajensis]
MILMQLNQLTKRFGAELILSNIKLEVQMNDRIAIVGRNGAGKSTLLKIMAGEMSHDSGDIFKPKETTIGYLAQNTGLESGETIWNEMEKVFTYLKDLEKELRSMEVQMADPGLLEDQKRYQQLLADYDRKQEYFKTAGGYQYEADIRAVLNGLNFKNISWNTSINSLSGGQKTRLALGKLLLTNPDVLILDEPTNHLDIDTLSWLESYLQGYQGAVVIVSHDRYFLDKIVNTVYEVAFQSSKKYHGNYSDYLKKKEADYEHELKRFEKQQEEIKRMEDFIQKNIVRATTSKRAQSRRKQLEKMDKLEKPKDDNQSAKFSFQTAKRSGNDVLKLRNYAFRYDDSKDYLFEHLSLDLSRGDSVALVGPNGVGKTTLLKSIIGDLEASKGEKLIGTNVQIGYYDQEQTKLNSKKTVLNELWDDYPMKNEKDIRTILGNFLFSGEDVLKPVSALSGGEKARLSLAKLMMKEANFLILDEPTNHLDLDSKEVLEAALVDYPGTLLFVSHDRYFINKIATQVIEMNPEKTRLFLGDYDYYVNKKQEEAELAQLEEAERLQNEPQPQDYAVKNSFEEDKAAKREERRKIRRIAEIETEIEALEEKLEENEKLLCDPEVYQDHEKSLEITEDNDQIQKQLEALMEEWETLHES